MSEHSRPPLPEGSGPNPSPVAPAHAPPLASAGASALAPLQSLDDFDFTLPEALIAQSPAARRSASRLLVVSETDNSLRDLHFADLPGLLRPKDLLVFNDSRVIKARLLGQKESGGQVEALVERTLGSHEALTQLKVSKKPQPGTRLGFKAVTGDKTTDAAASKAKHSQNTADSWEIATVLGRQGEFFHLRFEHPVLDVLEAIGSLPLPPYIEHQPDASDDARYQTVYARNEGSVAAPTAGLHFDEDLFAALDARGIRRAFVTLHVGAGTFQPVRTQNLDEHRMHSERFQIDDTCAEAIRSARREGGRVFAVGTTSLRTLESAAAMQNARGELAACQGETQLFIRPGYDFRIVDGLITNFHLPKSTLLMLVSAFAGYERIRAVYAHAIAQQYRFFSYGDAMMLTRKPA